MARLFVPVMILTWNSCVWTQSDEGCLACHGTPDFSIGRDGEKVSLFVHEESLRKSIHGGLVCVDCHDDIENIPHDGELKRPLCARCHEDEAQELLDSAHGKAEQGPTCMVCHGKPHEILSPGDPASIASRDHSLALCSSCHSETAKRGEAVSSLRMVRPVETYMDTVHGQSFLEGNKNAATCVDCHAPHKVLPGTDPESKVNVFEVARTCGHCHKEIAEEYLGSVHGEAIQERIADSATCTSCHGEHTILSPTDERSLIYAANIARDTCTQCHGSYRIASRYGISYGQVESYFDTYHGLATSYGSLTAANCASCHGMHNILPSSAPRSTVNPANLSTTCGQCHAGAAQLFISTKVHTGREMPTHWTVGLVRRIYLHLIPFVIGLMLIHNGLIYSYYVRQSIHRARREGIRRFITADIIQHLLLTVTFILLVVTGFAIKFPTAWWVRLLALCGMTEALRGTIHRTMAVMFILTCLYHLYYIVLHSEGRRKLRWILPTVDDLRQAVGVISFYLGKRDKEPRRGFFSYEEKIEYWALVWGSAIMIATGFVLWFPFRVMALMPSWVVDLAEVIHYYEAWLATLAIVVWHFFFTIFHPKEYPMNVTWLTGLSITSHGDNDNSAQHPTKEG